MNKLGILLAALVVILFFFAGYYLFVQPANKVNVDKYGMLILRELEAAIQNRIDADIEQYSANLEPYFRKRIKNLDTIKLHLYRTFGIDSLGNLEDTAKRVRVTPGPYAQVESPVDTAKVWGKLTGISNGQLSYTFSYRSSVLKLSVPETRLMGDLQHSFPADFYGGFLLLKTDPNMATTLYNSDAVPIGLRIPVDSLLTNSKGGFYPGITDLQTGGQDYKLFYIPLTRGTLTFALCGIKDAGEYRQALSEIPATFIYPIVIALFLLAIALPLIKFYTIGVTEAIRLSDMAAVCLSLLGGSMLITVTIIQVILLKDGDARMQRGLSKLGRQIDSSFRQEVDTAFSQLQAIDTQRARSQSFWNRDKFYGRAKALAGADPYDGSDSLVTFLREEAASRPGRLPYLNFDRVAWVNSKGLQVVTSSVDTAVAGVKRPYSDVSSRGYFKAFSNNTCFRLPGIDTAMVSMEAVLIWNDGAFRVVLARRSACPGSFLAAMSMDLYSVNRTVLPSGYGFCIIDGDGLVQIHSDPSRNLIENLVQQSGDGANLKAAIKGREKLYLPSTELYGRQFGLQLTPIAGMPYYLAVFYDKGYILPVNIRILVFSLICCGITLLSCVLMCWALLWLLVFRKQGKFRPLLFGPMDYLKSLIPSPGYAAAYGSAAILLEAYALLMLLPTLSSQVYSPLVNKLVLIPLLCSPFLVSLGLWLIAFRWDRANKRAGNYLRSYAMLVQAFVITLGALPAALFTWHAQNQEILQSVKREQLLMADQIQDRRSTLYQPLRSMNPLLPKNALYLHWQYQTGIYSLYKDSLCVSAADTIRRDAPFVFEDEYYSVAQRFGTINYDPQFVPVLSNDPTNELWRWGAMRSGNTLPFQFTEAPDPVLPGTGDEGKTSGLAPPQRLLVFSAMPKRYPYLGHAEQVVGLLVLIALLLYGMYLVVQRVSAELFLQKWTQGKVSAGVAPPIALLDDYIRIKQPAVEQKMRKEMETGILTAQLEMKRDEGKMDEDEKGVVEATCAWSEYFKWLFFKQCSPLEQYLLYHFACTGFLNYKNVKQIDCLLKKGILVNDDGQLRLFSPVFRAYLRLDVTEDMLDKAIVLKSDWQRFRIPFLVLLTIAAAFLFLTQQGAWQRIVALLAALSTALGSVRGIIGSGRTRP
jgi:hypothetical protein